MLKSETFVQVLETFSWETNADCEKHCISRNSCRKSLPDLTLSWLLSQHQQQSGNQKCGIFIVSGSP